jgi:predicted O-methyltransferase YrrM
MAITTRVKDGMNLLLRGANLRLESLTAERLEERRCARLDDADYFDRPVFPVPRAFEELDPDAIFTSISEHASRWADFENPLTNDVGYSFQNDYFRSPDAEVLYSIVRRYRPAQIVEVGSGHSTKISRQAILDGQLNTRLVCIDPQPRTEVSSLADRVVRQPVETLVGDPLFSSLAPGDILFIDSSHELSPGNDCVALYLQVLPRLTSGVLIHVHDVFLPYDYPRDWVVGNGWKWNEQYLVQAMLMYGRAFEVLWAGQHLQRTDPRFETVLPRAQAHSAASLWLRKL